MNKGKENSKKGAKNNSGTKIRKPRMTMSCLKSITWWDNQIKQEINAMKTPDLTYKQLVMKRRLERKKFHQSMCSILPFKAKSLIQSGFYPGDLGDSLRKFMKMPQQRARIWRSSKKIYHDKPLDTYDKLEQDMKSNFLEYYKANMEDNDNIDELLNKLFSTEVDPFSLSSSVKVVSKQFNVVPDLTIKHIGKPNMMKNEMIMRMINRDLKSLKKKKCTMAFGSAIAKPTSQPNKYDFKTKFVNIGHSHNELETFQHVWEGILHLETSKLFCAWLLKNKHIEPPEYLMNKLGKLKKHPKFKHTSDTLLSKNLEGFNTEYNEVDFYDLLSRHLSQHSDNSLDTLTSSSSLLSLDISDINIII